MKNKSRSFWLTTLIGVFKIVMLVPIFRLLAGSWSYWQGWVFLGVSAAALIIFMPMFKDKGDLWQERLKPGPGVKKWDYVILAFFRVCMMAIFVLGVLDGGRFHWSPQLPIWVYVISYVMILASTAFVMWAMHENFYFSALVRIQKDRGHKVVSSGPYAYVRHPGYISFVFTSLGFGLVLGSLWALIPGGGAILLFFVRTILEDRTLQNELPGYKKYAKKVRYRWVPGLW